MQKNTYTKENLPELLQKIDQGKLPLVFITPVRHWFEITKQSLVELMDEDQRQHEEKPPVVEFEVQESDSYLFISHFKTA